MAPWRYADFVGAAVGLPIRQYESETEGGLFFYGTAPDEEAKVANIACLVTAFTQATTNV